MGVECLLSTHGDELGMLEDLVVACEWLDSLTFRFLPRGAVDDVGDDFFGLSLIHI